MAYRGRPFLTLRLDRAQIDGLKELAKQKQCTVSDIVRDLIKGELDENHIDTNPKPLDGQISV